MEIVNREVKQDSLKMNQLSYRKQRLNISAAR